MKICSVDTCDSKHLAKGMCRAHYLRMYKHGTLEKLVMRGEPVKTRILAKVRILENGCWEYTGCTNTNGYGHVRDGEKMRLAHVIMYEDKNGPVPEGLELDHFFCSFKPCCNPDHVEPVTHLVNIQRAARSRRQKGIE